MEGVENSIRLTQSETGFENLLGVACIDLSGFWKLMGFSVSAAKQCDMGRQQKLEQEALEKKYWKTAGGLWEDVVGGEGPSFNDSDWSGERLHIDGRWQYGNPPAGNANYAWIQHFLYHLAPNGQAGFVLSKGSLTTKSGGEFEIRKALIDNDLLECVVNLPTKLFLNMQIPACLWFLRRGKAVRKGEVLFIDARKMGHLVNRRNRDLSDEDIALILDTNHAWRSTEIESMRDSKSIINQNLN